MIPSSIRVEIHPNWSGDDQTPFGWRARAPVSDVTDRVVSARWSESIRKPWGSAEVTFAVPWTALHHFLGPVLSVHDWLVIRNRADDRAMWFGVITSTSSGVGANGEAGAITAHPVTVRAEHWMSMFGREQVYLCHGDADPAGTFLTADERTDLALAAAKATTDDLGAGLEALIREFGYVPLPPTLGGRASYGPSLRAVHGPVSAPVLTVGGLGDLIGVMHGADGAQALSGRGRGERAGSPFRTVEAVPGIAIPDFQSLIAAQGASLMDLIQGTFGADEVMVELFGSLEDWVGTVPPATVMPGAPPSSDLSAELRRTPCIVYRMRPFRAVPLVEWAPIAMEAGNVPAWAESFIAPGLFSEITWHPGDSVVVDASEIVDLSFDHRLEDYVNATTVSLPRVRDDPLRYLAAAGLPMYVRRHAALLGSWLHEVDWPFFHFPMEEHEAGVVPTVLFPTMIHVRQRTDTVRFLVLHDTDGWGGYQETGAHAAWRALNAAGTSTHFVIEESGVIVPMIPDPIGTIAYHASGFNDRSIGIDMVNVPAPKQDWDGIVPFDSAVHWDPFDPVEQARRARVVNFPWLGPPLAATGIVDYTLAQKAALLSLVNQLTTALGIPKVVFPDLSTHDAQSQGVEADGADVFEGVIAHRCLSGNRSDGGAGAQSLMDAGYGDWSPL